MAKPLTAEKIEKMFQVYQEHPSVYHVAKVCQVSHVTASKYRDKYRWNERLEKIRKKAEDKVNQTLAARRARWLQQGLALQKVGTNKFFDDKGKLKTDELKNMKAGAAVKAIEAGIKIEREAVGEPTEQTTPKLIIEYVASDSHKKKPKKKKKKSKRKEK